jgi:DNA-binding FadR family transcriptional regulator
MIKNVHGNTVEYLGEAIIAGRFGTDGALPPEPLLCEELGVSRTVVREAVKALVAKDIDATLLFFGLLDAQSALLQRVESA